MMRSTKSWWSGLSAYWRFNPRSNGVRVRRGTAVLIRAGNIARGRRDWSDAANAYRQALSREPHLQHLWVQLAHMEKEDGAIDRATCAYEEAARLHPDDVEPLLHLGHIAKAGAQPAEAAAYFIAALQRDRKNRQAVSELARLMPDRDEGGDLWSAALAALEIDPAEARLADAADLPAGATVLDVTDLLSFFGQRRLPTGIQRVQIEVSLACLEDASETRPVFCLYASARRGWIRLSDDHFRDLCLLAKQSDDIQDPVWADQLYRIYRDIAVARTVRFSSENVLINLGTSWSDRNYLLDVRCIRSRGGVVYVPLVFDLIPLIGPNWFMQSLVRDYRAWFGSLLHSADGCLAISEATRRDLVQKSADWNAPMPMESVPVVRLDGDFRQMAADAGALRVHGLEAHHYVLFVSTLEPRKNHREAFKAWMMLAESLGEAAMPRLVCVGGRGWLNEDLHQMLRRYPSLRRMVIVLHGIPDDVLAALYEHCLFALYPSFYEGWGLPVSEALSYGKVPAISAVSSLPEAGGRFARYFDPYDARAIAATVRALLDDDTRRAVEQAIQRDYVPRTWQNIASDLIAKAKAVTSRAQSTLPRISAPGAWTLALSPSHLESRSLPAIWQGEALRHGRGWQSPGVAGCPVEGTDAALRFHWAGSHGCTLQIHFAPVPVLATVTVSLNGSSLEKQAVPGIPLVVSWPLPTIDTVVDIQILPTGGKVIVEKMVITPRHP